MTRLMSYVKNPVELGQSGGRDCLTVYGIGGLKGAFRGRDLSILGYKESMRLLGQTVNSSCRNPLAQNIPSSKVTLLWNSIPSTNFHVWGLLPQMGKGI